MLLDIDQAIINYGSRSVRMYQVFSKSLIGLAFLMIGVFIWLQFRKRMQTVHVMKENAKKIEIDPFHEETELVNKLAKLSMSEVYRDSIVKAQDMIEQINDCMSDLNELQENNEYELLDKINASIVQGKIQIFQNTKSIINRVTVAGDKNEINKRLLNSADIVQQVRVLLNETVNYLDSKSPSTKADLDNMTKALQTLNKTIE
ncbi:hypothetical protein [Enterococcus rivorum]